MCFAIILDLRSNNFNGHLAVDIVAWSFHIKEIHLQGLSLSTRSRSEFPISTVDERCFGSLVVL